MRRRRYLAAWGALVATVIGSVEGIKQRVSVRALSIFASGDVELDIRETNAPVEGGSPLEVTLEVENTGSAAVRPEIESRFDGETRATVTTTIDPGETKTLDHFSFHTYPVAEDDTVTVRFETEDDAVERTVDVHAVDELDPAGASPDPELAVEPGTTVLFEVESDVLGEYGGKTEWFVDGEYAGRSTGPWYSAYYARRGADHWQTTFESAGAHEVTAAVGDDETYRTSWTIDVTADGLAAPTIEGSDPEDESLEVVRNEPTDLQLDVAHPDGTLDRVVWWLGHADVVLGESDVSGAEDTASLELDGRCHGCPIVAWVIGANGATISESPWVIDEIVDEPDVDLDVTIVGTNDPVDAGSDLAVTVELENEGEFDVTRDVELIVGHDPDVVDGETVTVDGGERETIVLEFTTAVVERTQEFPARVETAESSDEVTVEVFGTEDFGLDVTIEETNAPVETGESLEVTATLENRHDSALMRKAHLVVGHDPEVVATEPVWVPAGESETIVTGYETAIVERDQRFPVRIETADGADEASVFVYVDEPPLLVTIRESNDPVDAGEPLEVVSDVENPGDSELGQTVELIVGHDPQLVDAEFVRLDDGERETIELGYVTATVPRTQSFPVWVKTPGDRSTRTVEVIGTEDADLDIDFPNCTEAAISGSFEAGDDLTVETLFVDSAGVGNAHYGFAFGDEVDAPFSGTVRFAVGDQTGIVDRSGDDIVYEVADAGFGATIGSVIYNWFGRDEVHEGNPNRCADERRPDRPSIAVDDVSPGQERHEVTFAYENPNDLELHGGAFVEGTTGDEPPRLDPGTHSFTVEWTPESDDERLVWDVDLGLYLYDETLRAETDPAEEYEEPEPDPELALGDYEILGDDPNEEYVTIQHVGEETVDASGWTVEDDHLVPANALSPYEFPEGFELEPDADVSIVTGSGNGDAPGETLSWGVDRHVWNEEGDVVRVFDADGDTLLAEAIEAERTAELTVDDQEGDGETLLVDEATATVAFVLEAEYDDEETVSEAFEADVPLSEHELVLDPPLEDDATVSVRVRDADTDDELAAESIEYVLDLEPATVEITALEAPDVIVAGDTLSVTAELENVGEETATQDVTLDVGAQEAVDTESIELEGGETATVDLSAETEPEDAGEIEVAVRSEDDEATAGVLLEELAEPARFVVTSVEAPAQVEAGDSIDVSATIENDGDESGDAVVELDIADQQGVDTETVPSLEGGDFRSVSFAYPTTADDVGELSVTVRTDDDAGSATVTVADPEPEEPEEPETEPEPEPEEPEPEEPEEQEPGETEPEEPEESEPEEPESEEPEPEEPEPEPEQDSGAEQETE